MAMTTGDPLEAVIERALGFVKDDTVVGLGAGRAATAFVRALAERVRDGLRVRGVPASEETASLARELGIPLVGLESELDVTVDGADEVDSELNLIKGYCGAFVRERIVASASRRQVILVTPDKLVDTLGSRGRLPVRPAALPAAVGGPRIEAHAPNGQGHFRHREGGAGPRGPRGSAGAGMARAAGASRQRRESRTGALAPSRRSVSPGGVARGA